MTIITVRTPTGLLDTDRRRTLAQTLTDAVLVPEVGAMVEAARAGFQVHFLDLDSDRIAIGGRLVADDGQDVALIDVCVMDGDWPEPVRAEVIRRVLAALAEATGRDAPSPNWWVNLRVIDDGSWGAFGDVLTMEQLLAFGLFPEDRAATIRASLAER